MIDPAKKVVRNIGNITSGGAVITTWAFSDTTLGASFTLGGEEDSIQVDRLSGAFVYRVDIPNSGYARQSYEWVGACQGAQQLF